MSEDHRPGAAHWIDHYVVPTNDYPRSKEFYRNVLGTEPRTANGTPSDPSTPDPDGHGVFLWVTSRSHFGSYQQESPLPPSKGLGVGLPCYGYYVRQTEIDDHLRHLDRFQVNHIDPVRTSEEGEPGIAIYWEDPDGNQLEFWAPDHLPEAAMDGEGALHIGRLASVTLESRDLARSADSYARWLSIDPVSSAEIPNDKVVFPLATAGRLVFEHVDVLAGRSAGHTEWRVLHTAFAVRVDEILDAYDRLWAGIPEWDFDPRDPPAPTVDQESLAPRTGIHSGHGWGWKRAFGRGDTFYDWDTYACHYFPSFPTGGSMAKYTTRSLSILHPPGSDEGGRPNRGGGRPDRAGGGRPGGGGGGGRPAH